MLKGFCYDHVAELFKFGGKAELGRVLGSWKAQARIIEDPNRPYIGSGEFFNAFWRTAIANEAFEAREEIGGEKEVVKAREKDREIAEVVFGLRDFPKDVAKGDFVNPFGRRLSCYSTNRRMAVSRKGYLGLVPFETELDDLVCVLLGGDMPFILRRQGPYFTLIGECYIHGIMNGEVLDAAQDGLVQLEEFSLQ